MSRALKPVEAPSDRREEILAVARELFFSQGFESASMRDVAKVIGFTQAAIYYHFASKDEILFALIDDFTDQLLALLRRLICESGDPGRDLEATVRAHILATRTHYREIKLVLEDKKLLAKPLGDRVRAREIEIYELYRSRIAELMANRPNTHITPAIATFTTLAAINFVYQWYRPNGPLELEAVADQTVQVLMRGMVGVDTAWANTASKKPVRALRPAALPTRKR